MIPTVEPAAPDTSGVPLMRPTESAHPERARFRLAAFHATRFYPGPVGELLSRELLAIEEFGYRLDTRALGHRVAEQILAQLPEQR